MIEIKDISFSYGSKIVLDKISMNLLPGKIYGLLGENGVGKTTLLTLLCGLKFPQCGTISIDGFNPAHREPSLLSAISYIPDEVSPVHDKAISWAKGSGVFRPLFDIDVFQNIAREFEVDTECMMDKMSNGQLKKTYIAFALACSSKYIILDEPTNGLDIPSKSQFRSALMKYTPEDSTIIISTHQVRDLDNVIDPIIILDSRSVLVNAGIEEITSKLYFDYGSERHPNCLYTENLPGGLIQVYPNTSGEDSKVNLEALFNTAYNNKELVKAIFSHE